VHESAISFMVDGPAPLIEHKRGKVTETIGKIGKYVLVLLMKWRCMIMCMMMHDDEVALALAAATPMVATSPCLTAGVGRWWFRRNVAQLVEDGATLQMGIGVIPDAVLAELTHHKKLGIHTEMFSDGIIDLVERGVQPPPATTCHQPPPATTKHHQPHRKSPVQPPLRVSCVMTGDHGREQGYRPAHHHRGLLSGHQAPLRFRAREPRRAVPRH
jgi:hypothetical protein